MGSFIFNNQQYNHTVEAYILPYFGIHDTITRKLQLDKDNIEEERRRGEALTKYFRIIKNYALQAQNAGPNNCFAEEELQAIFKVLPPEFFKYIGWGRLHKGIGYGEGLELHLAQLIAAVLSYVNTGKASTANWERAWMGRRNTLFDISLDLISNTAGLVINNEQELQQHIMLNAVSLATALADGVIKKVTLAGQIIGYVNTNERQIRKRPVSGKVDTVYEIDIGEVEIAAPKELTDSLKEFAELTRNVSFSAKNYPIQYFLLNGPDVATTRNSSKNNNAINITITGGEGGGFALGKSDEPSVFKSVILFCNNNIPDSEIRTLYFRSLNAKYLPDIVAQHLQHIYYIYELMGAGQLYSNGTRVADYFLTNLFLPYSVSGGKNKENKTINYFYGTRNTQTNAGDISVVSTRVLIYDYLENQVQNYKFVNGQHRGRPSIILQRLL